MLFHLCGPDRLTTDYFEKRAFYQGVCDSFSSIRAGNLPSTLSSSAKLISFLRTLRVRAYKIFNKYFSRNQNWSKDVAKIKIVTQRAYKEGWNFHQTEVAADTKLLSWVQRKDFWDADIRTEMKQQDKSN